MKSEDEFSQKNEEMRVCGEAPGDQASGAARPLEEVCAGLEQLDWTFPDYPEQEKEELIPPQVEKERKPKEIKFNFNVSRPSAPMTQRDCRLPRYIHDT